MDITTIVAQIIGELIISAPALWLAGRWRVGAERAKFTDALWITAVGVVVSVATNEFVGAGIGGIIQLVVYLYLVQKYYETDWVNAAVIAVLTVAILFVTTIVLAMVGIAILGPGLAGLV